VSNSWLERLVTAVAVRRLPFYWALTSDGRITFEPSNPLDAAIIAAVGNHHRRDKGFGPHSARMPQYNTNNRNVPSPALFRREGRGRLGDEATRSGHAGGLIPRLSGHDL